MCFMSLDHLSKMTQCEKSTWKNQYVVMLFTAQRHLTEQRDLTSSVKRLGWYLNQSFFWVF